MKQDSLGEYLRGGAAFYCLGHLRAFGFLFRDFYAGSVARLRYSVAQVLYIACALYGTGIVWHGRHCIAMALALYTCFVMARAVIITSMAQRIYWWCLHLHACECCGHVPMAVSNERLSAPDIVQHWLHCPVVVGSLGVVQMAILFCICLIFVIIFCSAG